MILLTKKSAEKVPPVVSSGGSASGLPRPLGTCCSCVRDQTETNDIRIRAGDSSTSTPPPGKYSV